MTIVYLVGGEKMYLCGLNVILMILGGEEGSQTVHSFSHGNAIQKGLQQMLLS